MMTDKFVIPNLPVPESNATRLPLLIDICIHISQILVLVVALVTAVVSILSQAEVLMVILRTAIAIIAVGFPLYVLNFLLGRYFVKATLDRMENTLIENQKNAQRKKEEEAQQSELDREA
jgi:hypothetical protein